MVEGEGKGGEKLISVYEDDPLRMYFDLEPESWMFGRKAVSQEEYDRLVRFKKEYKEVQALLKEIGKRPIVEDEEV